WFIAVRFLREGRMQTLLILVGVGVGVGVIVFLSALMNGLQTSLIKQTLGSQAHVVLRAPDEAPRLIAIDEHVAVAARTEKAAQRVRSIEQWQQVVADVGRVPGVIASSPTVTGPAFALRGGASISVSLRGVVPELFDGIIPVSARLTAGAFRLLGGAAVIGAELAADLGVAVGDKIRVVAGEGRAETFTVSGIFDLGNKDVNKRWVLIPLRSAQTLLDLVGGVSTLELKVADVFDAEKIAVEIASREGLVADSWMKTNAQLLAGLRSQDSSKYMIQFFVIVAVALGIASVLVVSVVQKSREIGILRAVGTSRARVMRIFLIQGGLVGLAGSAIGSALGAGLAVSFANLARNADGSPIFPVDLSPALFLSAASIAVFTGLIAAVVPARRAARLDPASAIRHG
ncbi:MAG: ABC transporter permease, partial [Byssovorax sp.]